VARQEKPLHVEEGAIADRGSSRWALPAEHIFCASSYLRSLASSASDGRGIFLYHVPTLCGATYSSSRISYCSTSAGVSLAAVTITPCG
jgi:hypothetical protein